MLILPIVLVLAASVSFWLLFLAPADWQRGQGSQDGLYIAREATASEQLAQGDYELLDEELVVYSSADSRYLVVVPDGLNIPTSDDYASSGNNDLGGLLFLIMVIVVAFLINILLTRFVIRGVMNPLSVLRAGVHEIRDGNLDYRISYHKKDELAPVCEDFNEMATRLSEMVAQRQKDEQSRRELIAGISHDLRTPLTSIKAYVEGIQKGVAATPEKESKYLETISSKAEDLEYIINQLFIFSRLDTGEFPLVCERMDIVEVLKSISSGPALEFATGEFDIFYSGSDDPIYCSIDGVQFHNVIQNILGNSVKHTDKDAVHVEISCAVEDRFAVVTVLDNGPGVPGAAEGRLFEIFYRGDESRQETSKGSGIGLAISKKIIEQLGGTISAESGAEGGLKVTIKLPMWEGRQHG
jgi:signal transduction histidine kinase